MKIGVMVVPIPYAATEEAETEHVVGYAETRAFALQAEAAGFDSIWVFDHLLLRYPGQPDEGLWEGWTLLTALAEATTRVELGTLVLCVPFRNPALLAKMAITLDEVSNGRLILGLGSGWHRPEFDAFGYSFTKKIERLEEALRIIGPLLREGRATFQGAHCRADDCAILPPGPRSTGVPILIGGEGPRVMRLVARYADCWNTAWYREASGMSGVQAAMAAACAAEGRDAATLPMTVGVRIAYPGAAASAAPGHGLSGSPAEVAARLRGFAAAGAAHVICSLTPSNMESLAFLAEALAVYRRTEG